MNYDFAAIELKWQDYWQKHKTFRATNPHDDGFDPSQPKFYVLDFFPYPSDVGLHVGHPLGYIATDIVARHKRMRGFNVLHPMGYDAFGLPAEQYAVECGVHPRITTEQNCANMTRQLERLGMSYDWDRSFATTDPDYYKWTQWIFLKLYNSWFDPTSNRARPVHDLVEQLESHKFYIGPEGELIESPARSLDVLAGAPIGVRHWHELTGADQQLFLDQHRLAYMAEVPVNWCPALGTVLANEEVTNKGRSERGNHPVYQRPLRQWMLRITAYNDRLLEDLELVDWPEPIKLMQRNWIGRSQGAMVDFSLANSDDVIRVFTTRPDTLFGATYMVLAPEHPLVDLITTSEQQPEVAECQQRALERAELDRMAEDREKTGVFTGAYALNPVNNKKIPIWIADYVLMGYGTGAIMAVPAHDQRDHDFACTFGLPILKVVDADGVGNTDQEAFSGTGVGVNSANDGVSLNGLPTPQAKKLIIQWLTDHGLGKQEVQYKLRDWLFSRQRYWGEPFPILHGPEGQIRAVDESDLPVELPEMEDFRPSASDDPNAPPQPPLGRAPGSWKHVEIDGILYSRELNTMPQWAGSCWYYLRFTNSRNQKRFVGKQEEQYWMNRDAADGTPQPQGVDLYVGGAEHAVLHLLYARFWHKVLYDLDYVSTPEPFGRLFNQGYIQAYYYEDERGIRVPAGKVQRNDGGFLYEDKPVVRHFGKMGKSLKNAVTPDEICRQYGCDTLRLYEMYLGPVDQSKVWHTHDIVGVHRFLQRFWRNLVDSDGSLAVSDEPATPLLRKLLHQTIKKVSDDMDRMSFNTAIAAMIELNNALVSLPKVPREVAEVLVLLLSPQAPHICEEIWQRLGADSSLSHQSWPTFDPSLLVEDSVEYPIQVNGKLRGRLTVPVDADSSEVEHQALNDDSVQRAIEGKTIRKVIIIKGKMINVVAN